MKARYPFAPGVIIETHRPCAVRRILRWLLKVGGRR